MRRSLVLALGLVLACSSNDKPDHQNTPTDRSIGGTVSGLQGTVVLQNGADQLTVTADGSFTFSDAIADGAAYDVVVSTQPAQQFCTVAHGSGSATADVSDVTVTCATTYTVGGTVTGLGSGDAVTLEDNGDATNTVRVDADGSFVFTTRVAAGAPYAVTVLTSPTGQNCVVTHDSGTMGNADVTDVAVTCTNVPTTLSLSVSSLALSVTGLIEYDHDAMTSGLPRNLVVTNTGTSAALTIAPTAGTLPAGTTMTTTCGATLEASQSCSITITPGGAASSDGTHPCTTTGTAPVPTSVTVSADNSNTVSANVVVLGYGCLYQGGYVFALDDSTAANASVGGTVVATTDQALPVPNGVVWGSDGSGYGSYSVAYDAIYGISEVAVTTAPDPSTGSVPGQTACIGANDGACDTSNIYTYYQNSSANAPVDTADYAAGLCKQAISDFSDWYLPAICELTYRTSGSPCGPNSAQNISASVGSLLGLSGIYWSSTEDSTSPSNYAFVSTNLGAQGISSSVKSNQMNVRCVRKL